MTSMPIGVESAADTNDECGRWHAAKAHGDPDNQPDSS